MNDTPHAGLLPCPFCGAGAVLTHLHDGATVTCEGPWCEASMNANDPESAVEMWNCRAALPSGAAEPSEPSEQAVTDAIVARAHAVVFRGGSRDDHMRAALRAAYAVDFPAVAPAPSDKVDTAVRTAGVLMEFGVEPIRAGEMAALAADVLAAVAPAGEPDTQREKLLALALKWEAMETDFAAYYFCARELRAALARRSETPKDGGGVAGALLREDRIRRAEGGTE